MLPIAPNRFRKAKGFTLIEIMVTVAIVGILAAVIDAIPGSIKQSPSDGAAVYQLSVSATASAYTLTMAPVSGGVAATDACGSFTLTSTGIRDRTGSGLTKDACWK